MTDVQLAWLSTIAWFAMTATLFAVLAHWSAGEGTWGGLPGIVRGLHDWASGDRRVPAPSPTSTSPRAEVTEI